jgi:integrase
MNNIASIPARRKGRPAANAQVETRVYINPDVCRLKVAKRTKFFDTECEGFYVDVSPRSANFHFRYRNETTGGKQRSIKIGTFDARECTPVKARAAAYHLKGQTDHGGVNVAEQRRQELTTATKHNKTVAELIELRIEWMKQLELKEDGERRPRIESWKGISGHLNNLVKPRLGRKRAIEVTRQDVAGLSKDIVEGKFGKASLSRARHMRRAVSGLYNWAAEAEQDYLPPTCQPYLKLGKLKERQRQRYLSEAEIRTLWRGLDDDDLMPWDRRTRLAIKLALTTMLRSAEILGGRRDELIDLPMPHIVIPLKRVKMRRVIKQPLNNLAREVIAEAKSLGDEQHLFASPLGDKPHHLRRTAATLAGEIGCPEGWIARCLDHTILKDEDTGRSLPTVTGKVYNLSKQLKQKRAVLDQLDAALRRIIAGKSLDDMEPLIRIAA